MTHAGVRREGAARTRPGGTLLRAPGAARTREPPEAGARLRTLPESVARQRPGDGISVAAGEGWRGGHVRRRATVISPYVSSGRLLAGASRTASVERSAPVRARSAHVRVTRNDPVMGG